MEGHIATELPTDDPAEIEAAISHLLEQVDELCAQMQRDQAEIEQIKAETRALTAESNVLKVQTRAILATLQTIE